MVSAVQLLDDDPHKCDLPLQDFNGNIVYFDAQRASAGSFIVPGVIDPDTWSQGSIAELSWIYFKGDPRAGPKPGHPFEFPFDNRITTFQLDLVDAAAEEHIVQNVMRMFDNVMFLASTDMLEPAAANSSVFWRGGAPFGKRGRHSMAIPLLNRNCTFYSLAAMTYLWTVPESMPTEHDYRLKLTTAKPSSTHLSGILRVSKAGTENDSPNAHFLLRRLSADLMTERVSCAAAGLVFFAMFLWCALRLHQRQRRIQLK